MIIFNKTVRFSSFILSLILLLKSSNSIHVGIWGGNGYQETAQLEDLTTQYGFQVLVTASKAGYAVNTLLPDLKAAGWQVVLRFADYTTADPNDTSSCTGNGKGGKFSYDVWEESITENLFFDEGKYKEILNYIDDGTLLGVMLADDVLNYGEFGWDECDPTIDDIENMGKFIKDNFPGAKTWIRLAATELQERNDNTYSSLSYIDGAISQFTVKNSIPNTMPEYAFDNKEAADDLGIEVICGLNIADGGDGTSGQVGWKGEGFYAMSATEILDYGLDFIDKSCCKYMLLWEYDGEEEWGDEDKTIGADYFNADSRYRDNIQTLSATEECLCEDGNKYLHKITRTGVPKLKPCSYLARKSASFRKRICEKRTDYFIDSSGTVIDPTLGLNVYKPAQVVCRNTCNSCDVCFENKRTRYVQNVLSSGTVVYRRCSFLSKRSQAKKDTICSRDVSAGGYPKPADACPQTCSVDYCGAD